MRLLGEKTNKEGKDERKNARKERRERITKERKERTWIGRKIRCKEGGRKALEREEKRE